MNTGISFISLRWHQGVNRAIAAFQTEMGYRCHRNCCCATVSLALEYGVGCLDATTLNASLIIFILLLFTFVSYAGRQVIFLVTRGQK